ncbi:hypothetical protein PFICI_00555 [Pestalotiopsis fici W106-1]|uniref:Uncharacterized protein n=1 Tax=Pestalotiopsis fici (strain W106-1 / CGMCC3.15140) TaxID=1229662 RepID=W3XMK9_PESFW|nr:uncharacterized protein PFICI_00555 [Pestalotiopsis fici W106-1]ETS86727.1 hypothetical protein PFICI_00555 [Pestalotiopsis fici W106-1]
MVLDGQKLEALLKRLDEQRDAYLESQNLLNQLLEETREAAASPAQIPQSSQTSQTSQTASQQDARWRKTSTGLDSLVTSSASRATGEDSDEEETGEDFFAQTPLEHQEYTQQGLHEHLTSYHWSEEGRKILANVLEDPKSLLASNLLPVARGAVPDRSHLSHHQVYDVGTDGAPLALERPEQEQLPSNALRIWHAIKEVNKPSNERRAVGRITVMHEPSPVLFGAIHYTMQKYFDVDELFKHLVQSEASSASLHRVYNADERRRRTFVFNFEYFTLLGDDCQPMAWQLADRQEERAAHHIAITRCSSVIALHLGGKPIKRIKNRSRRSNGNQGFVYDPFAAWQVLNIQCYPDWQCSLDVHDSTKHYVNGVEAFMVTILGEFKDAQRRFEGIYHKISRLITPPLDFMFNEDVREKLLFEDADFTFTRRYFWAAQTLGIVNESIKAMIDAYEDNFTEEVWLGTHKTLWLLEEQDSPRNLYFRKKMSTLRAKFETQMRSLGKLIVEIDARRNEIRTLREELFVGTSIQESRKSVENSDITVLQGHNIKILTMVSIFFLPLTFVTSVFGMTNMPTDEQYWNFGIVTACVCIPFFVLIGSLNSNRGMHFWSHKTRVFLQAVANFLAWLGRGGRQRQGNAMPNPLNESRSRMGPRRVSAKSATSLEARKAVRLRTESVSADVTSSDVFGKGPVNRPGIPGRLAESSAAAVPTTQLASMILHESRRAQKISYNLDNPHDIV